MHAGNTAPTLVISAAFDVQCPPDDGAKIAGLNPNASQVMIAGLSHLLRPTGRFDFADYARQLGLPQDPRVGEVIVAWLETEFPARLASGGIDPL